MYRQQKWHALHELCCGVVSLNTVTSLLGLFNQNNSIELLGLSNLEASGPATRIYLTNCTVLIEQSTRTEAGLVQFEFHVLFDIL